MFQQKLFNIRPQSLIGTGLSHFGIPRTAPNRSISGLLAACGYQPSINLYQQISASNPQLSHLRQDSSIGSIPFQQENSICPKLWYKMGYEKITLLFKDTWVFWGFFSYMCLYSSKQLQLSWLSM